MSAASATDAGDQKRSAIAAVRGQNAEKVAGLAGRPVAVRRPGHGGQQPFVGRVSGAVRVHPHAGGKRPHTGVAQQPGFAADVLAVGHGADQVRREAAVPDGLLGWRQRRIERLGVAAKGGQHVRGIRQAG